MVSRLSNFSIPTKSKTACTFCKQVALFWRENIKLEDSDKRDYLQKEQTAN